ncbi:hypothetical protein JYT79_01750, partial [Cardiobacterium sp. AH-315-I02]|nr:hypothetical protein [Cardiobacterium sp. AH-315-I02]
AIKNNKEDAMQRFSQLEHEQKSNEKLILETRDDLHMNYVRNEDLDKSISEFKHLIGKAIDQITSISRDLNQLIGEISVHRRKDDKSQ